jgi:glutathione synthase/RimK-type ligase-like ATP-grasp enzyme
MAWLDRLEADKVNIWNRIPTLRWNTNKSYLTMLGKKGVSVIPSIILTKPDEVSFTEISRWGTIVVKPTIGASAYGTERFDTGKGPSWQRHIEKMLADGPVIVQHYFEEIEQGEYSFIFFDKKYSHAVIKVPKKSEFRTQPWFGGSETHTDPDPAFVRQAEKVLAAIDEPLLYARVDGINVNGIFLLMELELAEPYLFLDTDSTSPQRFADAIVSHLG